MRDGTEEPLVVRIDKYTLEVNGIRVAADSELEAKIRVLNEEELAKFIGILDYSREL